MSRPLGFFASALTLSFLAGCPEGARMEQWTPEQDPHPPASVSSADARRAAEKEEDEGLAAALAASSAKPVNHGEGGIDLSGVGESGGSRDGIGLGAVGMFGGRPGAVPVRLKFGAPSVNGGLPDAVVQRVARQSFGKFRKCYVTATERDRYLTGKLTIDFVIGRTGELDAAKIQVSGSEELTPMMPCVKDGFAKLSFPQPDGGIVKVKLPITFTPGDRYGTVNGKPLPDVTLDDVKQALTDAGYAVGAIAPLGDTGVQVLSAKKGKVAFEITFVPFEEKRARLTEEEWQTLDAEALVHHYLGFGIAVKTPDRSDAKALLDAVVKPAEAPMK